MGAKRATTLPACSHRTRGKSLFLPRCLRELETSLIFLRHDWIRCPARDQEPVVDEFYDLLGIEKNKDYIFEFVNVW